VRIFWEQVVAPFALARAQPDLLHGMAFALPLTWTSPSVVTIFDLSFIRYPGRLSAARRLYLRAIVGASARRADRIIAISESTRQEIMALLGISPDKIDIAYPGVNSNCRPLDRNAVTAFRQQQGLPDRFILYLGTLEPRKNLITLIKAYAALPQRQKVKLVLAGGKGWGYEPVFALIEELGLENDVITPGYQPGDSLPMWYNSPELFVYPSVYEGFGMPLVEAMACGTPVIASNTSSLPEAVGEAGILVPADDPSAWVDAMSGLLTDPSARAEWSEKGRLHAATFTWAETASRTADTYRRVLSLNRPS
jgi:glycosyltransferase involved in cell wall biosynthesis